VIEGRAAGIHAADVSLNDSFRDLGRSAETRTNEQMKMFLDPPSGFGSKAVVTGDITQGGTLPNSKAIRPAQP